MKPFTNFESRVAPLAINNIDTDQIIPARFLKTTSKEGLDQQLFCDWRYDADGNEKPDFVLNTPRGKGGRTFLASPLTAAASAVSGAVADVRTLL